MTIIIHIPWQMVPIASVGAASTLTANLLSFKMIEKVNAALPEQQQISYFWWSTEVRQKYKQMYGRDAIVAVHDLCLIAMGVTFLLALRYWVFA